MDVLDGWSHVLSLGGVGAMWSASGGEEEGSCGVVLDWVMGGRIGQGGVVFCLFVGWLGALRGGMVLYRTLLTKYGGIMGGRDEGRIWVFVS